MPDVTISVRPNGSLKVEGPVSLVSPNGEPIAIPEGKTAIFLCRCGHSAEKPFCDGTHREVGFKPDGEE